MAIKSFFHPQSNTYSYVVSDETTGQSAIIDPVLDLDIKSGRTSTQSADKLIDYFRTHELQLEWILETHVHADHLTSAPYLREQLGGKIAIGSRISDVQAVFSRVFNTGAEFATDGSQFDVLFDDGDTFHIGELVVEVWHTPGHTPACATYIINRQQAFIGDTLFMPDMGTARCDFPGGDSRTLFNSIQRILSLPDATQLYMCHDYAPGGREYQFLTTVGEQKQNNIHINDTVSMAEFVVMRSERDASLAMPQLLFPSVQVNMRAGKMPPAENNGTAYLKIPLNLL